VPAGATTATTAPAPAGSIDDFPTPSPQGRTTRQPGEPLDGLADCESGNTNADTGNGYYGFVQFSAATWHGMGESGLPTDYDRSYQLDVARRLQQRSGWGQWPACARQLGLL
jgi:hypothetical protein